MKGYVYVLSNKGTPDVYAVGCTHKGKEEFIKELSIPFPKVFEEEYYFYTPDIDKSQQLLI